MPDIDIYSAPHIDAPPGSDAFLAVINTAITNSPGANTRYSNTATTKRVRGFCARINGSPATVRASLSPSRWWSGEFTLMADHAVMRSYALPKDENSPSPTIRPIFCSSRRVPCSRCAIVTTWPLSAAR